jgi:hypothetical protein
VHTVSRGLNIAHTLSKKLFFHFSACQVLGFKNVYSCTKADLHLNADSHKETG